MNWVKNLLAGSAGTFIQQVGDVADKFITTDDDKREFMIAMEALNQQRDQQLEESFRTEIKAKSEIIVAELNQDDLFTKRARPTIVYFGLWVIFYNYCLIPTVQLAMGLTIEPFNLPTEFWIAWGGVCGVYTFGRTKEKTGTVNKATDLMTGSSKNTIVGRFLE